VGVTVVFEFSRDCTQRSAVLVNGDEVVTFNQERSPDEPLDPGTPPICYRHITRGQEVEADARPVMELPVPKHVGDLILAEVALLRAHCGVSRKRGMQFACPFYSAIEFSSNEAKGPARRSGRGNHDSSWDNSLRVCDFLLL
jgi:hypothetical protein